MLIKRITIFDKEHYTKLHKTKRAISMRVNNERRLVKLPHLNRAFITGASSTAREKGKFF